MPERETANKLDAKDVPGQLDLSGLLKAIQNAGLDTTKLNSTGLRLAARAVFEANCLEVATSTRAGLRSKLAIISRLSSQLINELNSKEIVNGVPQLYQAFETSDGLDVSGALKRLIKLSNSTSARIETGAGAQRAASSLGHIPAQLLCAAVAAEIWQMQKGHSPDSKTGKVQLLCDAIWVASGLSKLEPAEAGDLMAPMWQRPLAELRQATRTEPKARRRASAPPPTLPVSRSHYVASPSPPTPMKPPQPEWSAKDRKASLALAALMFARDLLERVHD